MILTHTAVGGIIFRSELGGFEDLLLCDRIFENRPFGTTQFSVCVTGFLERNT